MPFNIWNYPDPVLESNQARMNERGEAEMIEPFRRNNTDMSQTEIFKSGTSGVRWDVNTRKRFSDPRQKYLEPYGFKVYSQNDEDGIISEIFSRIGVTDRRFIEFGVENGLECNSHYLLLKGWTGLWLEGSPKHFKSIQNKFRPAIADGRLTVENTFITCENINETILRNGFSGEIDLLSVDIDGNDYHVWRAITAVSPRVVVIEYNAKFPPECIWYMPYNEYHIWDGSDRQGASLKALEILGREKGYQLVGTNLNGINAFFVRTELAGEKFPRPATAEVLYNPMRFYFLNYRSGHPANVFLGSKVEGMAGVFQYLPEEQVFITGRGFWPKEYDANGTFTVQWMSDYTAQVFIRCIQTGHVRIVLHYQTLPETNSMRARVDGGEWTQQSISGEKKYAVMALPAQLMEERQIRLLEIEVEKLTKADAVMHNGDFRQLGIGINKIEMEIVEEDEDLY